MITEFQLLFQTAWLAGLSALAALLLGLPLGFFLLGLGGKIKSLISALFAVPFLLPAFLIGIVLLPIAGSSDLVWFWIVLAHAFMNAGFLALVIAASLSGIPSEQIEQAKLEGANRFQLLRRVFLPQISPAVAGATLLVALYSSTSFGLVISLGQGKVATLETEIAEQVLYRLNFQGGLVLAGMQTVLTLLLIFAASRFGSIGFSNLFGTSPVRQKAGWFSKAVGLGYISLFLVLVISILARANFPAGFALLGTRGARDVLNISVLDAGLNSLRNLVIALVISFPVAWWLAGRRGKYIGWLVLIPTGVSAVVIGLLFLIAAGYLIRASIPISLLLPIAQSLMLIPLMHQILKPARSNLSTEILDAVRLDGASAIKSTTQVVLPLIRRPVAIAIAFGSLASLGEFGAANFLGIASDATLSVVMFQLASRPGSQNLSMAMSIALIYLALSFLVVYLVSSEKKEF